MEDIIGKLSLGTNAVINKEIETDKSFIPYLRKMLSTEDPAKTMFIEMSKVRQNVLNPNNFKNDAGVKKWKYLRSKIEKQQQSHGLSGWMALAFNMNKEDQEILLNKVRPWAKKMKGSGSEIWAVRDNLRNCDCSRVRCS